MKKNPPNFSADEHKLAEKPKMSAVKASGADQTAESKESDVWERFFDECKGDRYSQESCEYLRSNATFEPTSKALKHWSKVVKNASFQDAYSRAVAVSKTMQPLDKAVYKVNNTAWKIFLIKRKSSCSIPETLEFMHRYIDTEMPTEYLGAKFVATYRDALEAVLKHPEAQHWIHNQQGQSPFLSLCTTTWFTYFKIRIACDDATWSNDIGGALNSYLDTLSPETIVDRILSHATAGTNDVNRKGNEKIYAFLCRNAMESDAARKKVYTYVAEDRMHAYIDSGKALPKIVAGLLDPLAQQSTPMDHKEFLLQLLRLGKQKTKPECFQTASKKLCEAFANKTLDICEIEQPYRDAAWDAFCDFVAVNHHPDFDGSWWADNIPSEYFDNVQDLKRKIPSGLWESFRVAYLSVADSGSLRVDEARDAGSNVLVAIVKKRITRSTGSYPFSHLDGEFRKLERCFSSVEKFRKAVEYKGEWYDFLVDVKQPIMPSDSDTMKDATIKSHEVLRYFADAKDAKELLDSILNTLPHKSDLFKLLTKDQGPTTVADLYDGLRRIMEDLRKSVDALSLESLAGMESQRLRIEGLPHLKAWWEARDSLRRLVAFIEASSDDQRRPSNSAVVHHHGELFDCIKRADKFNNGKEFKELEQVLARHARTLPDGITKQIAEQILDYCSAENKTLRKFRERNLQSLRRKLSDGGDEVAECKQLLQALNVFHQAMPLAIKSHPDTYNFEDLCHGIAECLRRHDKVFELLTPAEIVSLEKRVDSVPKRRDENAVTLHKIETIGSFECKTAKNFDAADGARNSYRITVRGKTSLQSTEIPESYFPERIDELMSDIMPVSKMARTPEQDHFATVIPILRRLVEIGIYCLSRGYREFVEFIKRDHNKLFSILEIKDGGEGSTGFQFTIPLWRVKTDDENIMKRVKTDDEDIMKYECSCAELSEMSRKVASECEKFLSEVQQVRVRHAVMHCFSFKEIGRMLEAMFSTPEAKLTESVTLLVKLRLGEVDFKMKELYHTARTASIAERIEALATSLEKLCKVVPATDSRRQPKVLELKKGEEHQWPLAVSNVYRGKIPDAFQLSLPMGTASEMYSARESFLRRVKSGVYSLDLRDHPVFCMVVAESMSELARDTFNLLCEECKGMFLLPLVIIVHSSLVSSMCATFTDAVAPVDTGTKAAYFKATLCRMFVVAGDTRSGKIDKAKTAAKGYGFKEDLQPSPEFLNGVTHPQELYDMLPSVGSTNGVIVEIGCGANDQTQSLIFCLALGMWATRDGIAVKWHQVVVVVLKVHTDLEETIPVVKLFERQVTSGMRASANLAHQFKSLAVHTAVKHTDRIDVEQHATKVGKMLAAATKLPLSARAYQHLRRPENAHEMKLFEEATTGELPDYLLAFDKDGSPHYLCYRKEGCQHLPQQMCCFLDTMNSEALWQKAFVLLHTPDEKKKVPGLVMTPAILQSLVRLDLSVASRRVLENRADDGVVTFVGETGSGKTQLVDTFCRLKGWDPPKVINVTTGTTESDIFDAVRRLWDEHTKEKPPTPTIVFFDEFNTSPAQDAVKRVMLDRVLPPKGEEGIAELPSSRDGWIFVAACNPYDPVGQSVTGNDILKYSVQRHVSPSLVQSCWRLPLPSREEEADIIRSICEKCEINDDDTEYFLEAVPIVHDFLRTQYPTVPYSLRTVSRLLCIYRHLDRITCLDAIECKDTPCKHTVEGASRQAPARESPIPQKHFASLALAVNYLVSIPEDKRSELELGLHRKLPTGETKSPRDILGDFGTKLRKVYDRCAAAIKHALPTELHREATLNETLAVTFLCVHSQTPLILLGPPGSSKTLATFMVLWGQANSSQHLHTLDPKYFQCSAHTTSLAVRQAMDKTKNSAIPIVHVFDEIGNADQAAGHPLRVLNRYLERSVFDVDGNPEQLPDPGSMDVIVPQAAFVGTSNYILDRSILGRAVVLHRSNPTEQEMHDLFPKGTAKDFVSKLQMHLANVDDMQQQTLLSEVNQHQTLFSHDNKLTMRDIYALLCERTPKCRCPNPKCPCDAPLGTYCCSDCASGEHCATRAHTVNPIENVTKAMDVISTTPENPLDNPNVKFAVLKTMGMRGVRILGMEVNDWFWNVQMYLLQQRFQIIQQLVANPQGNTTTPPSSSYHQSRQRPLMLVADKLSTIYAALETYGLKQHCDVIFGKYLQLDDQMISTTMLQIRAAMVSRRMNLFVDCEHVMDNLLDLFNGFYRKNDDVDSEFTVRVVLDGRSDNWAVSPEFNACTVLAVVDSYQCLTPAVESRFEKIFIKSEMFANGEKNKQQKRKVESFINDDLGILVPPSESIQGFHDLMFAALHDEDVNVIERCKQLIRPKIVALESDDRTRGAVEVLSQVKSYVKQQSLVETMRILKSATHHIILCPSEELQTLAKAQHVAQDVVKTLSSMKEMQAVSPPDLCFLCLRVSTQDMLVDVAIKNLLRTTLSVAVVAISQSSHDISQKLTAVQLFAVCDLIKTCASEWCNVRVVLIAPAVDELIIPHGWSASYCEELFPEKVDVAGIEHKLQGMKDSEGLCLNRVTPIPEEYKDPFRSYVLKSIAEECLKHIRDRVSNDRASTPQVVGEVAKYEEIITDLRMNLSLHITNHRFFGRIKSTSQFVKVLQVLLESLEVQSSREHPQFMLCRARDGGLPCAPCWTGLDNRDSAIMQQRIQIVDAIAKSIDDGDAATATALRRDVSVVRLSGVQSAFETYEIIKLYRNSKDTLAPPLSDSQRAWLRHFVAITPQGVKVIRGEDRFPDPPDELLHALTEIAQEKDFETSPHCQRRMAIHLASVAVSTSLNRIRFSKLEHDTHADPLSDPRYDQEAPHPIKKAHVCETDIFVRLALTFNLGLAKAIFLADEMKIGHQPAVGTFHKVLTMTDSEAETYSFAQQAICAHIVAALRERADKSLQRNFPIECATDSTPGSDDWQKEFHDDDDYPSKEEDTPSNDLTNAINEIRDIRDRLYVVERDCALPSLGRYVFLVRLLREQLFLPLPGAADATERLVGVLTRKMMETLTVRCLPKSISDHLRCLLGETFASPDCNVSALYFLIVERLRRLIQYNNDFVTECDRVLSVMKGGGNRIEAKRPTIEWPFVTPDHMLIASDLLEEVLLYKSSSKLALYMHLDEVLAGIPKISPDSLDVKSVVTYLEEPTADQIFCSCRGPKVPEWREL